MSEIRLGILGGGQLGSMLSVAAKKLNIKTLIYSDDQDAPAQNFCDEFIFGDYKDKNKINDFVKKVSIVTYEFENIPYETLNEINKFKTVNPKPSINRLIQHRLAEKDFVNKLNIRTTRYVSIEKKSDLETLGDFLPGILKTATMGYDGKGQYPIKSLNELNGLNIDFSKEYILEKLVKLKKEISVIITRFGNNRYEIYEAIENIHENQILKKSKIPADINNKLVDQSREWSKQISEELKYIGTLCVEFFIDRNDNLYVNEIAPRVHNSGHLTINAFNISQFENHIRAVCSLEQIPLKKLHNAEMINLIGNQITPYRQNIDLNDNEFFFDYKKKEIKDKKFENLNLINENNECSEFSYCPIILGVSFLDQIEKIEKIKTINFSKIAYPLLFLPFLSRSSEVIGKKIFFKFEKNEFLLNINVNISSNLLNKNCPNIANNVEVKILENNDNFTEQDWKSLYQLSEKTFVEETESLKKGAAGAGLTDND